MTQQYFYQPQPYNPYFAQQQRLAQMEQQYQYMQQPICRIIDDISSVTANEVSMNGEYSFFPLRDMKTIYAKQWQSDGTIRTLKFALIHENEPNMTNVSSVSGKSILALSEEATDGIMKRFDELETKIESLKNEFNYQTTSQIAKSVKK